MCRTNPETQRTTASNHYGTLQLKQKPPASQSALFTFRRRVSGRFSPTRYAVAVRSMWLALSSDLLSPAFQRELSLHHLGPVERQTLVCHHPPFRLQTSLARSRWVRRFLTICFRLDSGWSKQALRHFLHPFAAHGISIGAGTRQLQDGRQ